MSVIAPLHPPAEAPLPLSLLLDIGQGLAAAEDLWRPHAHHDAARTPARCGSSPPIAGRRG